MPGSRVAASAKACGAWQPVQVAFFAWNAWSLDAFVWQLEHAAAVAQMKRFCIERGAWMDENIDILRQYSHESKNKKFNH